MNLFRMVNVRFSLVAVLVLLTAVSSLFAQDPQTVTGQVGVQALTEGSYLFETKYVSANVLLTRDECRIADTGALLFKYSIDTGILHVTDFKLSSISETAAKEKHPDAANYEVKVDHNKYDFLLAGYQTQVNSLIDTTALVQQRNMEDHTSLFKENWVRLVLATQIVNLCSPVFRLTLQDSNVTSTKSTKSQ